MLEAKWLATSVLSQEGTVVNFTSSRFDWILFARLVSSTLRPELSRKKSSLEMRSPGREVKLVDCSGAPYLGKFHVLNILNRKEKRLWVPWVMKSCPLSNLI